MRGAYCGIDRRHALGFVLPGELDDEDRILCRKCDQHNQPDLGEDVIVHAAHVHAGHRRKQAHRHDQDDRQRQDQAFELRRQHEEDEQHRHAEDQPGRAARCLLLIGDAGPFAGIAGRQSFSGELLHAFERLAGRIAGRGIAIDFDGREAIVARHAIRPRAVMEGCYGADRNHRAGVRARAQVRNIRLGRAIGRVRLRRHTIGAPEQVEVVDEGGSEINLQGLEDAFRRNAEHVGFLPVDIGEEPRR